MPDIYGYENGVCRVCGEEKDVRHKNLYLYGSEGIYMCIECERDLLNYLREKQRYYNKKKLEKFKGGMHS
jgi:hypothetical protein